MIFVYKSQSGTCFVLIREINISASAKLKRLIIGDIHPKIIDNSIKG